MENDALVYKTAETQGNLYCKRNVNVILFCGYEYTRKIQGPLWE